MAARKQEFHQAIPVPRHALEANAAPVQQPKERNYLYLILGGLFLLALLVLVGYSINPLEGCVGVVRISGPLVTQDIEPTVFSDGQTGTETISEEIASADTRPDVKAVLLLIDSPGGSVVASRQAYEAVRALGKPSVAYINELGASGGYYVAAGADQVVIHPDALTGSIGAVMTFTEMSGLFSKLGITQTALKSGAMKDMGSQARQMTDAETAVLGGIVNESFQQFKSDIVESRGGRLDMALFEQALDARLLSGRQAKRIGLADELGDKKAAIKKAAEMGGIKAEEPRLCELSESGQRRGLLGSLSSQALELLSKAGNAPRLLYQ